MARRTITLLLALGVITLLLVGVGGIVLRSPFQYQATLVLPAASNLVEGTPIQIAGRDSGTVEQIWAEEGRAMVRISVHRAHAPLRDGTTARIAWKSVLGERILELEPGPPGNPKLPDGALILGAIAPVEFDQLLATLDEPTRVALASLVREVDGVLDGSEQDLNQTLQTSGPAVQALGQVLDRIGSDGAAIGTVVSRLSELTGTVAERRAEVSGSIQKLSRLSAEVVTRRAELREALRELPSTLAEIDQTVDRVPDAVDATVPLLEELTPAAERLPGVARELAPLLADLRPAVADLRPVLKSTRTLLGETPALLDETHAVLPPLTEVIEGTEDAAAFLRPYSPEIAGFFVNWGSFSANYDGNGQYSRWPNPTGASAFTNNPGVLPPGLRIVRAPKPGSLEGQPWTDATGEPAR